MKLINKVLVLLATSLCITAALHPFSDEYIALINEKATTWTAGRNFALEDWDYFKRIASGILPWILKVSSDGSINPHDESEEVPEEFDAREQWPECQSIRQIRDQSDCGSCWAFGAVEAMSDRICIHSNQTRQVYVSAENLVACCFGLFACGFGCRGGILIPSWEYWRNWGIVTGGLYHSSEGCQDYSLLPCEHEDYESSRTKCSSLTQRTPQCVHSCYNQSLDYDSSLTFGGSVYMFTNEKQIQLEIYKNGPVESSFTVFADFAHYKSGVYISHSDIPIGGHAIKILGWGVENDTKYWLVANSWNTDWADLGGYFKYLRGVNQGEIEYRAVASLPVL